MLPTAEESPLRRFPPFPAFLRGRHRPLPRFQNRGGRLAPAPHRPRGPIGAGIEETQLGESYSPRRFPPFPALVCSSSAFSPMSCFEIRVAGPEFFKPAPPRLEPITVDRGFLELPIALDGGGESPPPIPRIPGAPPPAPSRPPPILRSVGAGSPRLPIGAEPDGVPIPGNLPRRDRLSEVWKGLLLGQYSRHRRSCRCRRVWRRG